MDRSEDRVYADGVVRTFHAAYPRDFLEDAVLMLLSAYPSAHEDCRAKHAEPEVRDVYPHERRAVIEGQLRQIARDHGITASPESNRKNSHNYTLLTSEGVMLTESAVEHPDKIARPAVYRETYARTGLLKLFGEQPPRSDTLYAILQHGPSPLDRAQLGFAHIVFPDESYSEQVARVDLLRMFSDVVDRHRAADEETGGNEPDIRLRPDVRRGEGTED